MTAQAKIRMSDIKALTPGAQLHVVVLPEPGGLEEEVIFEKADVLKLIALRDDWSRSLTIGERLRFRTPDMTFEAEIIE